MTDRPLGCAAGAMRIATAANCWLVAREPTGPRVSCRAAAMPETAARIRDASGTARDRAANSVKFAGVRSRISYAKVLGAGDSEGRDD